MSFYKQLAKSIPDLKLKLAQAGMNEEPEHYVKKTLFTAAFLSLALLFIAYGFTRSPAVILLSFIAFPVSFFYLIGYVDSKISRMRREIAQEIVFAGRFLIIELESGVPLYNAFVNVSKNYRVVGAAFREIVDKVNLGTSMEDALNETITLTPSPELRKILWQVLNAMKTGADVAGSLNNVVDQVVRQQQIDVKEYGRKLNPMAMFYMMAAVIVPSLGTAMFIVLATFLSIKMGLAQLLMVAGAIGFVQYMFLAVIKSQRPPMEL